MREVASAFAQMMRTGSARRRWPRPARCCVDARRELYTILADGEPGGTSGGLPWTTTPDRPPADNKRVTTATRSSTQAPRRSKPARGSLAPAPPSAPTAPPPRCRSRPGQALRRRRSGARHRVRGAARARRSASSGPTGGQVDDDQHALHARAPERPARRGSAGYDVVAQRDEVRRHIGLVFQDTTLDGYLTAEQNLRLHAELYGVPRERRGRAHAAGDGRWSACGSAARAS